MSRANAFVVLLIALGGACAGAAVAASSQVLLAAMGVAVIAGFTVAGYRSSRRRSGALFPMAFVGAGAAVLALGAVANWATAGSGRTTWGVWLAVGGGFSAFAAGSTVALVAMAQTRGAVGSWRSSTDETVSRRQRTVLRRADGVLLAISFLNLITGEIIALSANVTSSRFSGDYGVAGRAWPVVLGALEASFALHAVLLARRRRFEDLIFCVMISLVFVATASRSFALIAFAAIAIVYLERRRPPLWLVTVALATGITVAGSIGYLRVSSEFGAATVNQSLVDRELPTGPVGQTLSNLATGPWVLSTTLHDVPERVPFQHGVFFLRDGLNLLDSSVVRSDRWVTESILERDTSTNGGMPPTLVGGLYLDFGYAGIGVGLFAVGFATVVLYPVASRRGLPGRLQYCLWCAYLLTSLYSYLSLKPAFIASVLLLEVLIRLDRRDPGSVVSPHPELRVVSEAA